MKKLIITSAFALAVLFAGAQLKVYSGGNVMVASTSITPATKLDINKGNNTLSNIQTAVSNNSMATSSTYGAGSVYWPGLTWYTTDNNATKPKAGIWSYGDGSGSKLFFGTSNSYATGITNTAMVIDPSGKVGIATTTPNEQLEIYKGVKPSIRLGDGQNIENFDGNMTEMSSIKFYHHYNTLIGAKIYTIKKETTMSYGGTDLRFAVSNISNNSIADALTINYLGYVGIGDTTPSYQLELSTNSAAKPTSSSWTVPSDQRLKNIEGTYTKGLKEVLQLNPIIYHYKNVADYTFCAQVLSEQNCGFSAQAVQQIFPEAVKIDTSTSSDYLNFDMHPILIAYANAFKEQQQMIDTLTAHQKTADSLLTELAKCCASGQRTNNSGDNTQGKTDLPAGKAGTTLQVELANNKEIILYQNEPNPFTGSTVIRYFVPENISGTLYISFTDMYGKQINKLELKEKGFGKIEASTENLATGIYSYSIVVNDKVIDTKKMMKNK